MQSLVFYTTHENSCTFRVHVEPKKRDQICSIEKCDKMEALFREQQIQAGKKKKLTRVDKKKKKIETLKDAHLSMKNTNIFKSSLHQSRIHIVRHLALVELKGCKLTEDCSKSEELKNEHPIFICSRATL